MRIDARKGRLPAASARLSGGADIAPSNVIQGITQAARPILEQLQEGDRLRLAELQQDAAIEFSGTFDALENDYDGSEPGFTDTLDKALRERSDALVKTQPRHRQAAARQRLDGLLARQTLAAQRVEQARRGQYVAGTIRNWGQEAINQIGTQPELYDAFDDAVDDLVADAPGSIRNALRDELRGDLASAYGAARIDDDPQGLIEDLNSGALDNRLRGNAKQQLINAASREIERRQREAEAAARRQDSIVRQSLRVAVEDVDQLLTTFGEVPENQLAQLQTLASQTGDQALIDDIQEQVIAATEATALSRLSPRDGQTRVDALREEFRGNAGGARIVEAAQKAVNAKRDRLTRDPVDAGIREGRITPIAPDALSIDVLTRRAGEARAYAEGNGVPAQILSESERDDFADYLVSDPNGFQVATGIAGTRGGAAVLAEVFPKEPAIVHLVGLAASGADRGFVRDARAGIAARAEKGFKSLVPKKQGRETARSVIGAAAVLDPDFAQAVIDTANAAYEVRGPSRNVDPENLDTELYARLINEAVGATYDGRGNQRGGFVTIKTNVGEEAVIAPGWMRANRFEKIFRSLSEDHIARASGGRAAFTLDGEPISPSQLRRMVPVPAGDGRYRLRYGPEAYVFDQDGNDYELDLNLLRGEVD
jgi:hypothetical protein